MSDGINHRFIFPAYVMEGREVYAAGFAGATGEAKAQNASLHNKTSGEHAPAFQELEQKQAETFVARATAAFSR